MLKNCADCLESNGSEGIFLLSKHNTGPPKLRGPGGPMPPSPFQIFPVLIQWLFDHMLKNCADCLESNGSEGRLQSFIFLLSKHSAGPPVTEGAPPDFPSFN